MVMSPEERERLAERVRTELFGNLVHYRQRCANELDDARNVVTFIEKVLRESKP